MTKRRVWRYKCDFCKKANCSSFAIANHEKGCTANPNRVCGMCKHGIGSVPLADLIQILRDSGIKNGAIRYWTKEDRTKIQAQLEPLREAAGDCPACMLAAIRQSEYAGYIEFDYKAQHEQFWKDVRDNEPGPGYYAYGVL